MSRFLTSPIFPNGVLPLRKDYSIGRADDNDIVLPSDRVSRRHARLERTASDYRVTDLGSRNGTKVNGCPVPPEGMVLRDRDRLEISSFTLIYREHEGDWQELSDELKQTHAKTAMDQESGGIMAGRFSGTRLVDVCQFVAGGEKTGTLTIRGRNQQGSLFFVDGRVVGAQGGKGSLEDACRNLLSIPRGMFGFQETLPAGYAQGTSPVDVRPILVDICRERDELRNE